MINPDIRGSTGESIIVNNTAGLSNIAGFLSVLVGLIVIACAFWITYEIAKKHRKWHVGKKLLWISCALLFNILTVIVYYFVEYKKK
jgi:hypothetical protein